MAGSIDPKTFEGFSGFHVARDAGTAGVLDEADIVTRNGARVSWNDPSFAAARVDYDLKVTLIGRLGGDVKTVQASLEPPQTDIARKRMSGVPTIDKKDARRRTDSVLADARLLAANPSLTPAMRVRANQVVAWADGAIVKHFTSKLTPWKLSAPGRDALVSLRAAMREDATVNSACLFTMVLLGIRNNSHRGLIESQMNIDSAAELASVLPVLAHATSDLRAQTLVKIAIGALEAEGKLTAATAMLKNGLDQRIATIRAADPAHAADIDDQMGAIKPS